MKELPISIQKETNGGFALPFIITIAAVVGLNTARLIKTHYSITRNR